MREDEQSRRAVAACIHRLGLSAQRSASSASAVGQHPTRPASLTWRNQERHAE